MNEDICREGMWLSEEVLLSKSTWDKKTLGKLRRGGVLHSEMAARVSDIDALRFYRVKASSDSETGFGPAEDLGVVLSKFIDMCDILEKFSAGGAEPLSSYILDRLQKYTGVPILPSSPLHFIVFIERLRKENYVMFSEDVAKYEQTDVSTDCPVDVLAMLLTHQHPLAMLLTHQHPLAILLAHQHPLAILLTCQQPLAILLTL
jgi:hypothetical protein